MADSTRVGVGIDFGTTYFGASIYVIYPPSDRRPPAPLYRSATQHGYKQPTRVQLILEDGKRSVRVGNAITASGERPRPGRQSITHSRFKLFLGSDETYANVGGGKPLNAAELAAEVLRQVKSDIDAYLDQQRLRGNDVDVRYAFSYPGTFPERAREAFIAAIRAAGFTNFSLIDEALATALAVAQRYPQLQSIDDKALVCDVGGGTLDLAVITITPGGWLRVKATHASHRGIGMANLDYALALHALAQDDLLPLAVAQRSAAGHLVPAQIDDWSKLHISPAWRDTLLSAAESLKVIECQQQRAHLPYTGSLKLPTDRNVTIPTKIFGSLMDDMRTAVLQAVRTYVTTTLAAEGQHAHAIDPQSIRYLFLGGGGGALPGLADAVRTVVTNAEYLAEAEVDAAALVQRGTAIFALEPQHIYDKRPTKNYGLKVFTPKEPDWPNPEKMSPDAAHGLARAHYAHYDVLIARDQVINADPIVKLYYPPKRGMKKLPFVFICGNETDPNHPDNELLGKIEVDLPDGADVDYELECRVAITREALFKASVHDKRRNKTFSMERQVPMYVRDWARDELAQD
jgi:molecular chaperone DnaK (HSP70)